MTCVPGDPNYASTTLLCHGDGTNGSTTFIDNSAAGLTLTANSLAALSTTTPKFGTACMDFTPGSTPYVQTNATVGFNFTNGQFTVETWGFFTNYSAASTYIIMGNFLIASNLGFDFGQVAGSLAFYYSLNGTAALNVGAAYTPTTSTWIHLAADRDASNVLRVYADGVVIASATVSGTFFSSTNTLRLGNDLNNNRRFPGRLDDMRVTKGVARYGGAFTPPTAAFADSASSIGCAGGLMIRGVGSISFPSPGLVAALAGARAIVRNAPTTRRGLLRPWQ